MTTLLHNSLGKNYSESRNIIYCKGVRNPICKSPISAENTKLVKRTTFITGAGRFGNVGEWSYPKIVPTLGQFLSNFFLVEKKHGGNRPMINLKNINKFIPYEHFQMEGLQYLKFHLEQVKLLCKIDLKEAYFSVLLNCPLETDQHSNRYLPRRYVAD